MMTYDFAAEAISIKPKAIIGRPTRIVEVKNPTVSRIKPRAILVALATFIYLFLSKFFHFQLKHNSLSIESKTSKRSGQVTAWLQVA